MHQMGMSSSYQPKKPNQWLTQKKKSISATPICKVCFKDIKRPAFSDLFGEYDVCQRCVEEMRPLFRKEIVHGYKVRYFYDYDGKIKEMIYQLKGCGDIELAPIFLQKQAKLIKFMHFGYTIVPVPSFSEKDQSREFNHVNEMFKVIGLPMLHALCKSSNVKQADLGYEERRKIKDNIKFIDGVNIRGKKILLVDDIITSGFTIKACADLLKKHGAKNIKILAIARTKRKG